MRWLLVCSAALLAVVMLAVACDTADPNDCYVNTSGGFGASGPISIGNSSCNPCVGDTIGCADAMDAVADVMDAGVDAG
jgi:hypothetical protein